jgi:hypothetical protein
MTIKGLLLNFLLLSFLCYVYIYFSFFLSKVTNPLIVLNVFLSHLVYNFTSYLILALFDNYTIVCYPNSRLRHLSQ